jgi:anti-sigma28 factor (negative regulator of flagellin synthesis)
MVLLLIVSGALANEEVPTNSKQEAIHCFTEQEVQDIDAELTEREETEIINEELIKTLKLQITNYQYLSKQDSLMLTLMHEENELLQRNVTQYKELVKLVEPKWYENKYLWFVFGASSLLLSAELLDNIK